VADGRFISYLRVSTDKQGTSGLGIEAQRLAVSSYLNGGEWEHMAEYVEVESGRKSGRAQLAMALAHCKRIDATLLIAKLDRLARNVHFISGLMETKIPFVACDLPTSTPFMLHIYAAMGEEEARAIGARTKAALAAARARGVKLGGPRPNAGLTLKFAANRRAAALSGAFRDAKEAGCSSLRQIAAYLDANDVKTVSGKRWTAVQVRRVMYRLS
jgi:DNA invertase Pin-like site-specific DNA recombinase